MSKLIAQHLDFGSVAKIYNLPPGAATGEPVTYEQFNAGLEGLAWKDSVRVATQANVNLASPGATLDGVTMSVGDRVLARAQTAQAENGLYIWNGAATPMTRALDANSAAELEQAIVPVEEGTSAGTTFRQTQVNFVLGTDPVLWTSFGTSAPSASETTAGIAELATQGETDAGTDDARIVTPYKLANWSSRKLKSVANIGDASATQFDITHNFNTRDVDVTIYRNSGGYDDIMCDVSRPSVNVVRLNFASAPTLNQFRVVIIA